LLFAGGESVNITSPSDGAKVQVMETQVVYDAALGPNGDHAVVTVERHGGRGAERTGRASYTLTSSRRRSHLCIKVVDKEGRRPGRKMYQG